MVSIADLSATTSLALNSRNYVTRPKDEQRVTDATPIHFWRSRWGLPNYRADTWLTAAAAVMGTANKRLPLDDLHGGSLPRVPPPIIAGRFIDGDMIYLCLSSPFEVPPPARPRRRNRVIWDARRLRGGGRIMINFWDDNSDA